MAGGRSKASHAKQPVTGHPLFPAIVALWFGALFGLGSLAIRVTLIENAVVASGIDLIVPAAAPPLGITARILMALLLATFGAMLGYALGTRIGRPKQEAPQRRRTKLSSEDPPLPRRADRFTAAQQGPPRPLSAFEELDADQSITGEPAAAGAGRRRALAMAEPTGPDYARDEAPLPGGNAPFTDIRASGTDPTGEADVLDLSDALPEETIVAHDDPFISPAPHASSGADLAADFDSGSATDHAIPVQPLARFEPAPVATRRFGAPEPAAPPFATLAPHEKEEPIDDRGLPPRNLGLRFGAPTSVEPAAQASAQAEQSAAVDPVQSPLPVAEPARTFGKAAAERLRSAPLDTLSQIELIERLALSIEERRALAVVAAVEVAPPPPAAPAESLVAPRIGEEFPRFGFEPREPIMPEPKATAPFAMPAASPAPASPVIPSALRPIDLDGEDGESDDLLPRFGLARSPGVTAGDELVPSLAPPAAMDEEADDAVADQSFSSLLDLGRAPVRQPLIRIEEPLQEDAPIEPVVVFPGHGSRPFAAPAPAPQPAPAPTLEPQTGARRFDAPAAAPTTNANPAAARQDPEETERALRAALATLQRMSGAA